MTERHARIAVSARAGGRCELPVAVSRVFQRRTVIEVVRCPSRAADWSHRLSRARGGGWTPANGLHACRRCHRWIETHSVEAEAGGWRLESWSDPAACPVWLPDPDPGWWLLDDDPPDRGPHLLVAEPYSLPPEVFPPIDPAYLAIS